jgi:hypothetical protein
MSSPISQKSGPTQVASHTSNRWPGGQRQQTGAWCFAAAEAIVQQAFDVTITQAEIAHNVLMARGAIGDTSQHAVDYHNGVQELWAMNNLADPSWGSVGALVQGDQTLNGYHRSSWGSPPLTGRTASDGGGLTVNQIITALDANGLVLSGNALHWKVIYGYIRYDDDSVQLRVYDPMTNSTSTPGSAAVINSMLVSYRITG